eukprot:Mycagemm_TRINITY_DN4004_c0_g1::TRINITY_DN4004_c0_g1_i1::g.2403::m.2403 type:complete len:203 gc:universal TRINITY_DN4004_c0_g1_i1:73-681(+)
MAAGDKSFKVICLGTIEVGKTSLIVRLVDGSFTEGKLENFDRKEKTITVDNKPVKLQITDTAGQERFRTLTSSYFRKANAMIIVYDITSKDSFDDLEGYIKEGTRYSDRSEKFIVGNKLDLSAAQPGKRVISYEQGKALADKEGIPFFEVSAKTGENVDKFFEAVARKLAGAPEAITPTETKPIDLSAPKPGKPEKKGPCNI